jgi:hypothetical protein
VIGQSFFGAQTVLRLELLDGSGTRAEASLLGETAPGTGAEVEISVEGPVIVFPDQRTSA